jgi:hypothetical protein
LGKRIAATMKVPLGEPSLKSGLRGSEKTLPSGITKKQSYTKLGEKIWQSSFCYVPEFYIKLGSYFINKKDNIISMIKAAKITEEQFRLIEENNLNFSKWVRKKLDEDFGNK